MKNVCSILSCAIRPLLLFKWGKKHYKIATCVWWSSQRLLSPTNTMTSSLTNTYLRFCLNFYPMITKSSKLHLILPQHYSLIQGILLINEILVPCFSNVHQANLTFTCFTFKSMNRTCAVKGCGTPNGTVTECNGEVTADGRGTGHQQAEQGTTSNGIPRNDVPHHWYNSISLSDKYKYAKCVNSCHFANQQKANYHTRKSACHGARVLIFVRTYSLWKKL